jgi:hypothetical protein
LSLSCNLKLTIAHLPFTIDRRKQAVIFLTNNDRWPIVLQIGNIRDTFPGVVHAADCYRPGHHRRGAVGDDIEKQQAVMTTETLRRLSLPLHNHSSMLAAVTQQPHIESG